MADAAPKLPERPAPKPATPAGRRTLEALRREVDRLFEDFGLHSLGERLGRSSVDLEPFWSGEITWGKKPAIDFLDNDKSFVVTAELPGMSEADVDLKYYDGLLMIRGEKKEDEVGRKKDHYLAERRYGPFQRIFRVPNGVDADGIEAVLRNGVLTITMPKTAEAARSEKTIAITTG